MNNITILLRSVIIISLGFSMGKLYKAEMYMFAFIALCIAVTFIIYPELRTKFNTHKRDTRD